MSDPAANTISAVSAANCRPASDTPACTITGHPCGGRAMLSGPRTDRYSPLWSSTCIFSDRIEAAFRISNEGVVGKAVPEPGDDVVDFARPPVPRVVFDMVLKAEI